MSEIVIKKIFFWVLAILFFLTAPIVVLYTMGYRFSPERGIFIYSGSVTIKPTPREVNVFIDGKQVPKGIINFLNYSYHVDGLHPGEHSLKVEAPDYYSWFKKIRIHSGLSTEFWNIFLIRKKYTITTYPTGAVNNFFNSPDNKRVALVENGKENKKTTIKIFNIKKNEAEYVFSLDGYYFSDKEKENIEWSPREGLLTVPLIKSDDGKREYFVVILGTREIKNLNGLLGVDKISQVRWSPREKNTVFYIANHNLFKVKLNNPDKKILVANDNVYGYDLSNFNLYYFSGKTGMIYEKSIWGDGDSTQLTLTPIKVSAGDKFRVIAYDDKRVAIISQNGDLFLFNDGDKGNEINKLAQNVRGLHFSDDGKKMVFWNNNEIFVYFTRKWETQPIRKEGETIGIARFFRKIDNVEWFRDYEHIIFSVDGTIKMTELDSRSVRNMYDIVKLKNKKPKVIYIGEKDRLLFSDFAGDANDSTVKELKSLSLSEENKK